MQFLTNNRPAPTPLTEAELNMSRNAGKCWAQARRWRELGDAKMADDLDAKECNHEQLNQFGNMFSRSTRYLN